jgi:hypothetical protein
MVAVCMGKAVQLAETDVGKAVQLAETDVPLTR